MIYFLVAPALGGGLLLLKQVNSLIAATLTVNILLRTRLRDGIFDCRQQFQCFRGFAVRLCTSREHWIFFSSEDICLVPPR
jgi:hypothetical protein